MFRRSGGSHVQKTPTPNRPEGFDENTYRATTVSAFNGVDVELPRSVTFFHSRLWMQKGGYEPRTDEVRVRVRRNAECMARTLTHETFHAVEAKTYPERVPGRIAQAMPKVAWGSVCASFAGLALKFAGERLGLDVSDIPVNEATLVADGVSIVALTAYALHPSERRARAAERKFGQQLIPVVAPYVKQS